MSFKIVLFTVFTGLIPLVWPAVSSAQQISPNRAIELYVDFDRTLSCPNCNHEIPKANICGWKGRPYRDEVEDGCRCGKKSCLTYYNAYCHWPSPFSVLIDHGRSGCKWGNGTDTTRPRLRDKLDVFANVRLLPPVRHDNGYCGPQCDPYGIVGKSRRGVVVEQADSNHVTALNDSEKFPTNFNHSPHASPATRLASPATGPSKLRYAELMWNQQVPTLNRR